jgi:hypothetical protein
MRTRTRNALILAAIGGLAGAGAYFGGAPARQRAALEAIPEHTFLLVTIDPKKVRASPLAGELGALREVSEVSTTCGFDPLDRAREIVIAIPEEESGEFGLAVTHDLTRDEVGTCAKKLAAERGDGATLRQEGPYVVLEASESIDPGPKGQIVWRDGAPLLVGRGAWLGKMRGALDGTEPRVASQKAHSALREVVGANAGEAARPALVATAVLPKALRERLRRQMVTEGDAPGSKSAQTMDAILAVGEVAISVKTTSATAPVTVFAELRCEKPGACETVRAFLERKRTKLGQDPLVRLMGFGPILDAVTLEANGEVLDARAEWAAADVRRVLSALGRALFPPPPDAPPLPSRSAPPAVSATPDEVLRPPPLRDR